MPFFDKIRQALGFSDTDDDIDDAVIQDDAPSKMYAHVQHKADTGEKPSAQTAQDKNIAAAPDTHSDAEMAGAIFDKVLEIFNQSLPGFLQQSVDPAAQRQYLYKSLDDGLKAYIAGLKDKAAHEAEARWRKDNDALQASVKTLEQRAREIDEKRSEISQKQLSSDRQRRALNERVHDLESTVARLEAEKEQFELERQSMVNKLKVASVYEKENNDLREQLNDLRANNLKAGNGSNADNSTEIDALNAQIGTLNDQLKQFQTQTEEAKAQAENAQKQAAEQKKISEDTVAKLNDQILELQIELEAAPKDDGTATIAKLNARIEELGAQAAEQAKQAELQNKQAEEASAAHTAQIKELEDKLAAAPKDDGKAVIAELNAQIEKLGNTISSLQSQVEAERHNTDQARKTIAELQRQIDEADPMDDPEIQAQLKQIQERLDQYEGVKKRNEETIATLRRKLEDERRKNAAPQPADKPKNQTPKPADYKPQPTKYPEPQNAPSIDDILGDTDWVVRQDQPAKKSPSRRNADRPKPQADNDPQMKLF